MKIAMIASEVTPFAKTGGLADVLGTLSVALQRLGHELCVIAPAYRCVLRGEFRLEETGDRAYRAGCRSADAGVRVIALPSARVFQFISFAPMLTLIATSFTAQPREIIRITPSVSLFSAGRRLELLRRQPVDVIHCHDWQAALAVIFLKTQADHYPELAAAKTVFTIHNLGFQGIFDQVYWPLLNLDAAYFTPQFLEFFSSINLLKGALIFADKITTVSPSYAEEIMTAEQGFGLDGVLRERAADLVGILNGVDYSVWNPSDRSVSDAPLR